MLISHRCSRRLLSALISGLAVWRVLERRLADIYAREDVRIFDVIATPHTPGHTTSMARVFQELLHEPDATMRAAIRLETGLGIPDCTGGVR